MGHCRSDAEGDGDAAAVVAASCDKSFAAVAPENINYENNKNHDNFTSHVFSSSHTQLTGKLGCPGIIICCCSNS